MDVIWQFQEGEAIQKGGNSLSGRRDRHRQSRTAHEERRWRTAQTARTLPQALRLLVLGQISDLAMRGVGILLDNAGAEVHDRAIRPGICDRNTFFAPRTHHLDERLKIASIDGTITFGCNHGGAVTACFDVEKIDRSLVFPPRKQISQILHVVCLIWFSNC
jgi:hypothetical protein